MTVEKECQDVVEQTIDKFQRLDVLIPNAGIFAVNSLATMPMEEFDKVMNINCRSVVHIMKLAIPHLIETKGNIVNISSIAGLRAVITLNQLNINRLTSVFLKFSLQTG